MTEAQLAVFGWLSKYLKAIVVLFYKEFVVFWRFNSEGAMIITMICASSAENMILG